VKQLAGLLDRGAVDGAWCDGADVQAVQHRTNSKQGVYTLTSYAFAGNGRVGGLNSGCVTHTCYKAPVHCMFGNAEVVV
jgi:hypothetical protein